MQIHLTWPQNLFQLSWAINRTSFVCSNRSWGISGAAISTNFPSCFLIGFKIWVFDLSSRSSWWIPGQLGTLRMLAIENVSWLTYVGLYIDNDLSWPTQPASPLIFFYFFVFLSAVDEHFPNLSTPKWSLHTFLTNQKVHLFKIEGHREKLECKDLFNNHNKGFILIFI